jgi:hypothetical protein
VISIDEAEHQLALIAQEQEAIQSELDRLGAQQHLLEAADHQLLAAETILTDLRHRIDTGLDEATRTTVVRALVRRIEVHTESTGKPRRAKIIAHYAFADENAFVSGSY